MEAAVKSRCKLSDVAGEVSNCVELLVDGRKPYF
jgi:hypothetical protein